MPRLQQLLRMSFFVLGAIAIAPACRSASSTSGAPPGITIVLRNERVDVAVERVSRSLGKPMAVTSQAQATAESARVSLVVPAPSSKDVVERLFRSALESSGYVWRQTETGIVVDVAQDMRGTFGASGAPTAPPSVAAPLHLEGVRRVSPTEAEITRSAFDTAFEASQLARIARVVPYVEEGRVAGLKVFGIRAGSPLAALGFENGDTIYSVNGHTVAEPDAALEAYTRIHRDTRFDVQIRRRDAPMTLTVRVVPRLGSDTSH